MDSASSASRCEIKRFIGAMFAVALLVRPAVEAALHLAAAGPTSRTRIFARFYGTRARPATDRWIALRGERVLEQVVVALVRRNVVVGPRRERVDLDDAASDVEVRDRCRRARRRFHSAQTRHPCLL